MEDAMAKKKKKIQTEPRNYVVWRMKMRGQAAGFHNNGEQNPKREESRTCCRKPVSLDD